MRFKPSLMSDETARSGEAPTACGVLSEAGGGVTLFVDQSTDRCGGGGSSTHRDQGTAFVENSEVAGSKLRTILTNTQWNGQRDRADFWACALCRRSLFLLATLHVHA
jgi:hypothetical protein